MADIVDQITGTLCEIKTVHEISTEHLLQLALYLWMYRRHPLLSRIKTAFLFHVDKGESIHLGETTLEGLDRIVSILLDYKRSSIGHDHDDVFIARCLALVT
jgi:hypothetical protein